VRVLVDTSFAARGPSGTAVYLGGLLPELRNVEVVEARQRVRFRPGAGNPLRSAANLVADLAWIHGGLPLAARRAGADAIHHPLPAHSLLTGRPQVVTVHDVAFERMPERFDRVWRAIARRRHRRAVRRAAAVIAVSESTAEDAVRLLGATREKVIVAPHGPGQPLPAREPGEPPRHFLYLGDDEPRKNLDLLLAQDAPLPVVLAGAAARTRGGVDSPGPEEIADLLAGAAALVHPSLHEGFGLTLLEAMAAGTPVIAVRNPGTEEVCGHAALLVEPAELGEAMRRVAGDPALRARLRADGRERAACFSWRTCALHHERAYTLAAP
jgi:glycosyltransferase involved in cell wall biosynthesis